MPDWETSWHANQSTNNISQHADEDEAYEDEAGDDEDALLSSMVSKIRDEDALHLTRLARGHAEQKKANRMSLVNLTNTSNLVPDAIPLAYGRSQSERSDTYYTAASSVYSGYAAQSRPETPIQPSALALDRGERFKRDVAGKYKRLSSQLAQGVYNPLAERRMRQQQQSEQDVHLASASTDTLNVRLASKSLDTDNTPTTHTKTLKTRASAPLCYVANSEETLLNAPLCEQNSVQDRNDEHDELESQSSASGIHQRRRRHKLAKEFKEVLSGKHIKSTLRHAISRTKQVSYTLHIK
jgi:hypothetical protein